MEGQKRIGNVAFWCALGAFIVVVLHCSVGGKLGNLLFAVYAYIVLRNLLIIFIFRQPSRLEGKPLPASLYLLPAPAPQNFLGIIQLYAGPIIVGLIGWLFGGDQTIQPTVSNIHIWITVAVSAIFHLVYVFTITYNESTYPYFGSLEESAPFRSYLNVWWGILKWAAVIVAVLSIAIGLINKI